MNIQRIERKLSKINAVFTAFNADGKISLIEKDLLLGYVRDLYELIKEEEAVPNAELKEIPAKAESPSVSAPPILEKKAVEETPVVKTQETYLEQAVEEVVPPVNKPIIVSKPKEMEETQIIPDYVHEEQPVYTPNGQFKPVTNGISHSLTATVETEQSELLAKLFTFDKGKELSDKLAFSPISDVSKSMGINEKYFTITELFGGNSEDFNTTCKNLNELTSFQAAKESLVNSAIKYNWTGKDKWSKAQNFIKHISRKYV